MSPIGKIEYRGEKGICRWAATGLPGSVALWVQAGMDPPWQARRSSCRHALCVAFTVLLLDLSAIYFKFGNLPWIAEMFDSLKPARLNPLTARPNQGLWNAVSIQPQSLLRRNLSAHLAGTPAAIREIRTRNNGTNRKSSRAKALHSDTTELREYSLTRERGLTPFGRFWHCSHAERLALMAKSVL